MSKPVIVVVGAGPGVSGSVARRFADEGYDVGLLGQDQGVLDELVRDLEARGAAVGHAVVDSRAALVDDRRQQGRGCLFGCPRAYRLRFGHGYGGG